MASIRNLAITAGTTTLNTGLRGASNLGGKIVGSVSGFAKGAQAAAMSEMPGITAAYGFAKSIGGGSLGFKKSAEAKETKMAQVISLEQVRQLKSLTEIARSQLGFQKKAVDLEQKAQKEEKKRHQQILDKLDEVGNGDDGDDGNGILGKLGDLLKAAGGFILGTGLAVAGGITAYDAFGRKTGPRSPRGRRTFGPPTSLARIQEAISPNLSSGGTQIQTPKDAVETSNKRLEKLVETGNKIAAAAGRATISSARITKTQEAERRKREVSSKPSREQKILDDANKRFLAGFQKTTTQIFKEELLKVFPDPKGVSARTASGEMYRGTTLGDILKIDNVTAKIFGKRYGPLFSQLADAYLEVGASKIGENLFGNIMGTAEESRAITGQILGNYKAGKKTLAAEQLIYGLTGIPLGTETLANKFGFANTTQGVGAVANILGAATQSSLFGVQSTYIDPRTGKEVAYTGFGDAINQIMGGAVGGYGGMFGRKGRPEASITTAAAQNISYKGKTGQGVYIINADEVNGQANQQANTIGSMVSSMGLSGKLPLTATPTYSGGITPDDVAESTVDTSETIHQLYENTDEWGSIHEDTMIDTSKADISTQQQVGTGIMGTFQSVGQFLMGGLNSVVNAIMSRPAGGGTSVSIGGFGGSGDFMSMMGNMIGSTAIALGANAITKKIKDPNLRMIANVGLNVAGQKFLLGNLGGVGGTGASIFSQGLNLSSVFPTLKDIMYPGGGIGGGLGNPGMGSSGGGMLATGGAYIGEFLNTMGLETAGSFIQGATGAQVLSSNPGAYAFGETVAKYVGPAVGVYYGYDAFKKLFDGNVAGAAVSGMKAYGALASNPYVFAAAVVLDILGVGKKKPMKPVVERAIAIRGNNDPTQIRTIQERHKDMSDLYPGLDSILMAVFNTLKLVEKQTGQTPFTHASIFVRSGADTIISLYRESEFAVLRSPRGDKWGGIKYHRNYGKPQDAFKNPGSFTSQVIDFITESVKKELTETDESIIAKAADTIQSKTFSELSSGVIKELENLNPEVSSFYAVTTEAQRQFDDLMGQKQKLIDEGIVRNSDSGKGFGAISNLLNPKEFESTELTDVTRYVDSGSDSGGYYVTTPEPVGIVDAGTGQIVPYGSVINYTDANGKETKLTLNRDDAGSSKVVGIINGIPIFDVGTEKGLDVFDYIEYAKRTGIDLPNIGAPETFLSGDTRTPEQKLRESQRETSRRNFNVVSSDNSSTTVNNITTNQSYGTIDPLRTAEVG